MEKIQIKSKDRDAIIQSLRAGVVPRIGHKHIQVGRSQEVAALINDINRISEGGSAVRFVIGEYGSGKTFFLSLIRAIALEKKLVTTTADLNPGRRLQASGGQARSLYSELMNNLATRAKPDGNALPSIIEKFITNSAEEANKKGLRTDTIIRDRLSHLNEMVGGYDFTTVITAYLRGYDTDNEETKNNAIRWLRAEFTTKIEARSTLGVRTIIDDISIYDHLKLMARFIKLAGYSGFLICLDEMVNIYKLANTQARNSNYEQILRILNDCLQGVAVGCGFIFGGTPEFLSDTRKGLYSYQALASRLAENVFAQPNFVDFSGPVIRLSNLSPEDIYILLTKLNLVYAYGDPDECLLPDEALHAFINHCNKQVGDSFFRTPRTTIKQFVDMLAILDQNREVQWNDLVAKTEIKNEHNPDFGEIDDDELTTFRL